MTAKILETNCFATLIGGGTARDEDIALALKVAPLLIAVDGGADRAFEFGVPPDWVVGDLDSISKASLTRIPRDRVIHITEQDTTDFDKCLRQVRAPILVAVGFAGPRLDHQLAVLSTLVKHSGQHCVVVGADDLVFHCPTDMQMQLPVGTRVSLFPMRVVRGRSKGLRWPIDDLELAPGARLGTSNKVDQPDVKIAPDTAGLLVILPREFLPQVLTALASGD